MDMNALSPEAQLNAPEDMLVKTTKRRRGRPTGSGKGQEELAKEQEDDRGVVNEALPGLGFNSRSQACEYGCARDAKGRRTIKPGQLKHIEHLIGIRTGKSIPASRAIAAAEFMIASNTIDPVKEYLEAIKAAPLDFSWADIARKIFGEITDFETEIFKKWMTAAVARVFEPGCAMDWMMILCGLQGIGKSAVGRALVPNSTFFGELTSDLDVLLREPQRMNMSWINELPEVDSFTTGRRSDREKFKNLISTREDLTRVPYASYPERMPRAFVFYGNSNRAEFIEDSESRRTFMIQIPDGTCIDFRWVEQNRDALWAKAIAEYRSGTRWIWTRSEYEIAHEAIMQYRLEDPIEGLLDDFIRDKKRVASNEIIRCVLQVPPHLQDKSHSKRVTDLMNARGWKKYTTSMKQPDGSSKSVKAFKRPENLPMPEILSDF